jgi:3',5'-cyclic AMP phosphodiesterase CpdA
MKTIVHLSDVHFGRVDEATVEPLIAAVRRIAPSVVVVSGDLTQRAREEQFEAAKHFLDALPQPQIVVPGNHDVPFYNVFARFIQPLDNFRRYICTDTEPVYRDSEIVIVGVNTARSLTFKNGRINEDQVERVRQIFCDLPDGMTKIVVMHHPIDLPREFPQAEVVGRAEMAVTTLAACGADVYLSGHYHLGHTGDTTTRYHIPNYSALIVHAGTAISTRGRGEPNSFNLLRIDHPSIVVDRYSWVHDRSIFELFKKEHFRFTDVGWVRVENGERAGE